MSNHGGLRARAGRPSSYRPEIAEQLLAYVHATRAPSLRQFSRISGISQRQIRRWELQFSDLMNAIGALRLKQDIAYGRAA